VGGADQIVIFVVDDDDAVRDSLKILLESHGMCVHDYRSAREFCAAFRPVPQACLIIDLHLPEIGGLEFLASHRTPEMAMPVIMITGRGDQTLRDRARELGVAAFLDKPVDDRRLIAEIHGALAAGTLA